MYKDPKHWSLAFHSYVHLTMLQNHVKMNSSNKNNDEFNLSIMERSIYSAKYCFLKNIHDSLVKIFFIYFLFLVFYN